MSTEAATMSGAPASAEANQTFSLQASTQGVDK
jgi:hypothetical protein